MLNVFGLVAQILCQVFNEQCEIKSTKVTVRESTGGKIITNPSINAKQTRLIRRRRNQETEEFKKKYRKRSGIEATNSGLKRTTGLSRLRVRGKASVFHAMLLKVTGWKLCEQRRIRSF